MNSYDMNDDLYVSNKILVNELFYEIYNKIYHL